MILQVNIHLNTSWGELSLIVMFWGIQSYRTSGGGPGCPGPEKTRCLPGFQRLVVRKHCWENWRTVMIIPTRLWKKCHRHFQIPQPNHHEHLCSFANSNKWCGLVQMWLYLFLFPGTLPETNIAPENGPSQKETSIPTIHFQGLC